MSLAETDAGQSGDWSRIFFPGFHPSSVSRFHKRYPGIGIRTEPPPVVRIADGLVRSLRAGETDRTARHVGVYDADDKDVEESIRVRDVASAKPQASEHSPKGEIAREDRPAYYLGAEPRPYGNVLLELICRAWAWEKLGQDRLAVLQCQPIPEYVFALFALIPNLCERLEVLRRPTRFREILVPAPAFVIRRYAHLEMRLLAERMAAQALPDRLPKTEQPLYLSRSRLGPRARRILVDEERFEQFLESQGFRVVAPETLPIREQIALFNRHKWIVSPRGSACHSRLFALDPINLVVLTNKLNANYILCDLLSPGTAHYANVFATKDFLSELGIRRRLDSSEPMMLRQAVCLQLLKKLGLVGAKALFPRNEDREQTYRRLWLDNAYRHARQTNDARMLAALAKLGSD